MSVRKRELPQERFTSAPVQILLQLEFRRLQQSGASLPSFSDIGFQVRSQTDEDGILLYVFALIGTVNKRCVEVCAGDGIECNTANLILHHGWDGLMVDGNADLVARGKAFYRAAPETRCYPPRFVCSWITRDNINQILVDNDFTGEIDLLSLDLDGNDYWIWKAIEVIQPRVVILEYNDILGPNKAWTIRYSDQFQASDYPRTDGLPNFGGASLPAFVKLGRQKGYRLIGCNRLQYNAIFIQEGCGEAYFPEVEAAQCLTHPKVVWGIRERFTTVKDLPWVEV